MRPTMIGAVLALSSASMASAPLAQAGEPPVKTVAKLDAKDPKYDTEACKAARTKAIDYEEPGLVKKVLGMGGNALVPFAGTAASTALGLQQDSKQARLNRQVAAACVSDPLNEETPLISAPKAQAGMAIPTVTANAPPALAATTETAVETAAVTQ